MAATIKTKVDKSVFQRRVQGLTAEAEKATRDALKESMERLKRKAKTKRIANFKDRTGNLRKAIKYRINYKRLEGTLYVDDKVAKSKRPVNGTSTYIDKPYGVFVHEPTGIYREGGHPYLIKPSAGKDWLVWKDDLTGRSRRARMVIHPGSEGNPFLEKALNDQASEIREIFRRRLAQSTR